MNPPKAKKFTKVQKIQRKEKKEGNETQVKQKLPQEPFLFFIKKSVVDVGLHWSLIPCKSKSKSNVPKIKLK